MPRDLATTLQPFLDRVQALLLRLAESDPAVRQQLRDLGEYLVGLADGAAADRPAGPAAAPAPAPAEPARNGAAPAQPADLPPAAAAPPAAERPGPSIHELAARLWSAPAEPAQPVESPA